MAICVLGNHLRYFGTKFRVNVSPSPISLISRQNNAKHYHHYFDGLLRNFVILREQRGRRIQ